MRHCCIWLLVFSFIQTLSAQNTNDGQGEALTIEAAVTEAVNHNLSLLAERYNISVAQAKIITAGLRPNPVLTLDADHVPWAGTTFSTQNEAGPEEYAIRTDFLFERAGKRSGRIAVAQQARTVADLQFLDTLRGVVLDVQNAFIETLLAKASLALARENANSLNNLVRINQNRVQAGDLAPVELTRVQLAELQFENTVKQAELRLQTAQMRLQLLLGRLTTAAGIQVQGDFRRSVLNVSLPELEQQADQRRPDLSALRQDQARSLSDVRLQIATGKVDYTVGTEYRRQQGVNGRGNSLGFFVQTNLPIFNRNQGEVERARQEQSQIQARLHAITASINNEVQIAYATYVTSKDALDKIEHQMLGRARDVRGTTEYSYRRGEASLVEFLDAQRAYNEAVQSYNEAEADFARSLYSIDAATGVSTNR